MSGHRHPSSIDFFVSVVVPLYAPLPLYNSITNISVFYIDIISNRQLPNMIHFPDCESICLNSDLSLVDTVLPVLLAFSPIQFLCLQCDRLAKLSASTATHPNTVKVLRVGARSIIGRSKDGGSEKPCASNPHLRHVLETLQQCKKRKYVSTEESASLSALDHMTSKDGANISKCCKVIFHVHLRHYS